MTVLDEENASTTPIGPLSSVFRSCNPDPVGTIHRAWSVTLLLTLLFFIVSIIEVGNLQGGDASLALIIAAIWTVIIQFAMIIIGTFIIKRFSTSFSVGFLLGLVLVVAQQYLLLAVTFWQSRYGAATKNVVFANLAFGMFVLYTIFALTLTHFKDSIMVAAIDARGWGRKTNQPIEEAL